MKKIKHLPAPLSQKKAMRLQYQVNLKTYLYHIVRDLQFSNTYDTHSSNNNVLYFRNVLKSS